MSTVQWPNIRRIDSSDNNVSKFVYTKQSEKPAVVESVLYKYPTYQKRTVICCSTQSGCSVGCRFCGAGDYFVRSLSEDEIEDDDVEIMNRWMSDIRKVKEEELAKTKRIQELEQSPEVIEFKKLNPVSFFNPPTIYNQLYH